MSTVIIVLLVIVLVVAIVLKKRADNQSSATLKKGTAAKATKKVAAKKVSRTTLVREEQEPAPQTTTAISESLRQKIEQQITDKNYQAVEAQINQLLKQDNSQHELYLFLLDIHLAQKDDFAIDQLIKHIKALKLDAITEAAEAKQREYEKNKQPDSIEFSSSSNHFHQTTPPVVTPAQNNNADFDALAKSQNTESFDDLQTELVAPIAQETPVETAPEVQPLDFNFTFEQKQVSEPVSLETETLETKDQQPLEFSFNLDATPTAEPSKTEEVKPELDFNFSNLEVASNKTDVQDVAIEAPSLDFNFDQSQAKIEQQPVIEKSELSFELPESTAVEPEAEFSAPITHSSNVVTNDPLVHSFPDLQQLNEAQLNLDLAEQYIELGAYASAELLLNNSQPLFNPEQQQLSQKLLNKIAS